MIAANLEEHGVGRVRPGKQSNSHFVILRRRVWLSNTQYELNCYGY